MLTSQGADPGQSAREKGGKGEQAWPAALLLPAVKSTIRAALSFYCYCCSCPTETAPTLDSHAHHSHLWAAVAPVKSRDSLALELGAGIRWSHGKASLIAACYGPVVTYETNCVSQ